MTLATRAVTAHRRNILTDSQQTITYKRGSESVSITSAIGNEVTYEVDGPDGLMSQIISMDWFIPKDAIVINGEEVEPKMNDQITASDGKRYEPMRPAQNMPAVVSHCNNEFWLVHSKLWVDA